MAEEDEEILMVEVFRPQLLKMWNASKHSDPGKVFLLFYIFLIFFF